MALLKKIKASTLMETLVAPALIVIIFIIASMILNNVFSNSIKNNTQGIKQHLYELQYLQVNEKLSIPYYETYGTWDVTIDRYKEDDNFMIEFEAVNTTNNKSISLISYEIK